MRVRRVVLFLLITEFLFWLFFSRDEDGHVSDPAGFKFGDNNPTMVN